METSWLTGIKKLKVRYKLVEGSHQIGKKVRFNTWQCPFRMYFIFLALFPRSSAEGVFPWDWGYHNSRVLCAVVQLKQSAKNICTKKKRNMHTVMYLYKDITLTCKDSANILLFFSLFRIGRWLGMQCYGVRETCKWTLLFEWKDVFRSSVDDSVLGFRSQLENAMRAWVDWQIARNSSEACSWSGILHLVCDTVDLSSPVFERAAV